MKEIHYFVADDGTRFEDEMDCHEYEFNCSMPKIPMLDDDLNVCDDWDTAVFCYISSEVDIEKYTNYYHQTYGYIIPNGYGYFYWDNDTNDWENLDEAIDELEMKVEHFKGIKVLLQHL